MARLNQIIAIANGVKGRTQKSLTAVYHKLQREDMLKGISRKYRPKDEEGEQLPSESNLVHYRVSDGLQEAETALTELFDVVATQDEANTDARADVVVDGKLLLGCVPVTTLLFLEKQLVDIHTLVDKLPVLDPSEEWKHNPDVDCFVSKVNETTRTKKVLRNHVKAEATREHPAQVEVFTEDVVVGYWETMKFSGCVPEQQKKEMLNRVRQLQDAVKAAREEANTMEAGPVKIGKTVFDFLFRK